MHFDLAQSPFRNIHKFSSDDLPGYLDPLLRDFVVEFHRSKKAPVAPSAFVFGSTHGIYLCGYDYSTPGSFICQLKHDAKMLKARRVLIFVEVRSVAPTTEPEALLVTEIQAPSEPSTRLAYHLLRSGHSPISDDWTLPVEDPHSSEWRDPVEVMVDAASRTSRILGPSEFFVPIFESTNPADTRKSA